MISHQTQKNHTQLDAHPPQGLSEALRGNGFFLFFFIHSNRRGGAPPGAGAIIVPDGEKGDNFRHHNRIHVITKKIVLNWMPTRLRASPRHGGATGFFILFSFTKTAAGAPHRGRRQSSYLMEREVTIPVSLRFSP